MLPQSMLAFGHEYEKPEIGFAPKHSEVATVHRAKRLSRMRVTLIFDMQEIARSIPWRSGESAKHNRRFISFGVIIPGALYLYERQSRELAAFRHQYGVTQDSDGARGDSGIFDLAPRVFP